MDPFTYLIPDWRTSSNVDTGLEVDLDLVRLQVHGSGIALSDVCQLRASPNRPTAIITLGPLMIAGVMDAHASNGLRYPDDVSLVYIGDIDLARHATPAISSLTWDLNEMGRTAAKILLDRIRDGDAAQDTRPVNLPTRFIVRARSGAPTEA